MKRRTILPLLALLLTLASGCGRNPTIETSPHAAAPGETVRIRLHSYRGDTGRLRVTAGDKPAHIVHATSDEVVILMPSLDADSVTVAVVDGGRTVATTGVRVLRARSLRLLLLVGESGPRLLRATPSNHAPTGLARTRRTRLSFDIINENNVVVYSGSIPAPGGQRRERFSKRSNRSTAVGGVSPGADTVVPVWIPMPEGPVHIGLFEAGPNLDLGAPDDRAKRRAIGQVEVSP